MWGIYKRLTTVLIKTNNIQYHLVSHCSALSIIKYTVSVTLIFIFDMCKRLLMRHTIILLEKHGLQVGCIENISYLHGRILPIRCFVLQLQPLPHKWTLSWTDWNHPFVCLKTWSLLRSRASTWSSWATCSMTKLSPPAFTPGWTTVSELTVPGSWSGTRGEPSSRATTSVDCCARWHSTSCPSLLKRRTTDWPPAEFGSTIHNSLNNMHFGSSLKKCACLQEKQWANVSGEKCILVHLHSKSE